MNYSTGKIYHTACHNKIGQRLRVFASRPINRNSNFYSLEKIKFLQQLIEIKIFNLWNHKFLVNVKATRVKKSENLTRFGWRRGENLGYSTELASCNLTITLTGRLQMFFVMLCCCDFIGKGEERERKREMEKNRRDRGAFLAFQLDFVNLILAPLR